MEIFKEILDNLKNEDPETVQLVKDISTSVDALHSNGIFSENHFLTAEEACSLIEQKLYESFQKTDDILD